MFPETTSAVLNALAEASVRALLVVGIAVAAAWRRPAAFRHAVFAGALCVMLLLPPATALLPQLPLAWYGPYSKLVCGVSVFQPSPAFSGAASCTGSGRVESGQA
jgi:hypothetical protein